MALNDKSACVRATAIESTAQRCKKNPIYSPKIVEQSQITAFDKSTNVRRATAFAISVINDKATIPLLINLLKDPNGDVRNWAAFAININKYDNSDIRDCFVEMLQDKNEEVRIEAIIGLSYRKDKRVLSVLCDCGSIIRCKLRFRGDRCTDDYDASQHLSAPGMQYLGDSSEV